MTIRKFINKYIVIALITGVLSICVIGNILFQARNLTRNITENQDCFLDIYATGNPAVKLYLKDDRAYFLLPSSTDIDSQTISFDESKYKISVNGKKMRSGEILSKCIVAGEETEATIQVRFGGCIASSLTVILSENIPSVFISTESGNMDAIKADKNIKEPGRMACILPNGNNELNVDFDYIKARGRSSFSTTEKKSYRVKFDKEVKLLDLNISDEILFIGNSFDSSKMRNYIAYEIAKKTGAPYTVNTEYVDLYLNGEYAGNYLVTDKMKDGERLGLSMGEGYLLEMNALKREDDEGEDNNYFLFNGDATMDIVYPEQVDDKTLKSVGEKVINIKNQILSCDTPEKFEDIKSVIDVDSFIAMFLTDELTDEIDPNRYSTYFYIGNDGKMYAGPAWDYDKAWGAYRARGQYIEYNSFRDGLPEWLYENESFRKSVKEKWNGCYKEDVLNVINSMDNCKELLSRSVEMDYAVNNLARYQNVDTGNYAANVDFLKYFVMGRYKLIDKLINNPDTLCRVQVVMDNGARSLYINKGDRINARQLKFLCELNDAAYFVKEDGSRFEPDEVVDCSMTLTAVEGKMEYELDFEENSEKLNVKVPDMTDGAKVYHKIEIINLMAENTESDLDADGLSEAGGIIYVADGEFVDSSGLEYIYKKYDSEQLNFENGCRFWERFPVYCDLTLYANMDSDDNH